MTNRAHIKGTIQPVVAPSNQLLMTNRTIIETYYRHHRDELLAYVSSRLGDVFLAEDMVQEVFLRLMQGDRPITELTLPSLVYTMSRNLVADHYRHIACRREYLQLMRGYLSEEFTQSDTMVHARDIVTLMERGLRRLPEPCRDVYRLHIYDGMQAGEISEHLGQSYKAVEYRLGQARKAIRNYLRKIS